MGGDLWNGSTITQSISDWLPSNIFYLYIFLIFILNLYHNFSDLQQICYKTIFNIAQMFIYLTFLDLLDDTGFWFFRIVSELFLFWYNFLSSTKLDFILQKSLVDLLNIKLLEFFKINIHFRNIFFKISLTFRDYWHWMLSGW